MSERDPYEHWGDPYYGPHLLIIVIIIVVLYLMVGGADSSDVCRGATC